MRRLYAAQKSVLMETAIPKEATWRVVWYIGAQWKLSSELAGTC
jgi:hypothetical protein